jgi:hypothetical protein
MNQTKDFYLPRELYETKTAQHESKIEYISQSDLLSRFDHVILLGQPGDGKTSLLESLKTTAIPYKKYRSNLKPKSLSQYEGIILDAFDEVCIKNQDALDELVNLLEDFKPKKLVISSRDTEWSQKNTSAIAEALGIKQDIPILRIRAFNESELEQIYQGNYPKGNFKKFKQLMDSCHIGHAISNPLYFKTFSKAFSTEQSEVPNIKIVFNKAIEKLAGEYNDDREKQKNSLTIKEKINCFEQICTKMLLCNLPELSLSRDAYSDIPTLGDIMNKNLHETTSVLDSNLFQYDSIDKVCSPVHRVFAEYSAAKYLCEQINQSYRPIMIDELLTLIATNNTIRGDLTGLLGWMLIHGDVNIRQKLLPLEVKSFLANPAINSVDDATKRALCHQLIKLGHEDPYFYGFEFSCYLNLGDWMGDEQIKLIQNQLNSQASRHMKSFLLRWLQTLTSVADFREILQNIKLNREQNEYDRIQASLCLYQDKTYAWIEDFDQLLSLGDIDSLKVLSLDIKQAKGKGYSQKQLRDYLDACKSHCVQESYNMNGYIRQAIESLSLPDVESLLDYIVNSCICNCHKSIRRCECLFGISKIALYLLDKYVDINHIEHRPYDFQKLAAWIKNLRFKSRVIKSDYRYCSVRLLTENKQVRKHVLNCYFKQLSKNENINNYLWGSIRARFHPALQLDLQELPFLIEIADQHKKSLWLQQLYYCHKQGFKDDQVARNAIKILRSFSNKNAAYMKIFKSSERNDKKNHKEQRRARIRQLAHEKWTQRKQENKKNKFEKKINTILSSTPDQIEALMLDFSMLLLSPQQEQKCLFTYIAPRLEEVLLATETVLIQQTPTVREYAKLTSETCQYPPIYYNLMAFCLIYWRKYQSFERMELTMLKFYYVILQNEHRFLADEKKLILKNLEKNLYKKNEFDAQEMMSDLIEPQLISDDSFSCSMSLLRDHKYESFRAHLLINWLKILPNIKIKYAQEMIVILIHDQKIDELREMISSKADSYLCSEKGDLTEVEKFWIFWAFLISKDEENEKYFSKLHSHYESIFLFQEKYDQDIFIRDIRYYFTPRKVKLLLENYHSNWPKVELPNVITIDSDEPTQKAYRFLTKVTEGLNKAENIDDGVSVCSEFLENQDYADLHDLLRNQLYELNIRHAHIGTQPPSLDELDDFLDKQRIISEEQLKVSVIGALNEYQNQISNGRFNSYRRFQNGNKRYDENTCTVIVADKLTDLLLPRGISFEIERQLQNGRRVDMVAQISTSEQKPYRVNIEAKGQWHKELYTAIESQLKDYNRTPDTSDAGIYLVYWFGAGEKVANCSTHSIQSATELKTTIDRKTPESVKSKIDVFVLDVSAPIKK